jgi:lysozyme
MVEVKASAAAFDLIKRFEGLRLEAYLCPAGVWTVGWGHTAGVKAGDRVTAEEAEALLGADVAAVEDGLVGVIHVPLNQGQWDALVSLCFNLRGGGQGLARFAPRLLAKINAGNFAGAADEFLDINRAGGQILAGLTRRREAESALFQQQA